MSEGDCLTLSLPRAIIALDCLTIKEKMIISRIINLSSRYMENGGCTLSNKSIADRHKCSTTVVSIAISKAAWLGIVQNRKDEVVVGINPDLTESYTQKRRISLKLPDWLHGIGEAWGDFYFSGSSVAESLVDMINEKTTEAWKNGERTENIGLHIIQQAIIEYVLNKEGLREYKKWRVENPDKDPAYWLSLINLKEGLLSYLKDNGEDILTLFKFSVVKVYGNKVLGNKNIYLSEKKENSLSEDKKQSVTPTKRIRTIQPESVQEPEYDKNEEFHPLSQQLADIIKSHKHIKTTPAKIKAWSNEIRILCKDTGVTPSRVKRALDWYADHIGGEYIPVIESGGSLRQKFEKLLNAIERAKPKVKTSQPRQKQFEMERSQEEQNEMWKNKLSTPRLVESITDADGRFTYSSADEDSPWKGAKWIPSGRDENGKWVDGRFETMQFIPEAHKKILKKHNRRFPNE